MLSACQGKENDVIQKSKAGSESYPFATMSESSVCKVTAYLEPPNKQLNLNKKQIEHFVRLLKRVITYNKVKPEQLVGQNIRCKIDTGKEVFDVKFMNPYIIINDEWYKADYDYCEEINHYINSLIEEHSPATD